ncbi:hypothetical protein MAR_003176 [Mya arenaria]|uniref:MYCBP-associated protein n=1 Tax=Mya arenaria TaxID=6604 RepID=A0ABY7G599_MYAAR|nr:hypothetical protein MAR_003176 [Mya arenaria]
MTRDRTADMKQSIGLEPPVRRLFVFREHCEISMIEKKSRPESRQKKSSGKADNGDQTSSFKQAGINVMMASTVDEKEELEDDLDPVRKPSAMRIKSGYRLASGRNAAAGTGTFKRGRKVSKINVQGRPAAEKRDRNVPIWDDSLAGLELQRKKDSRTVMFREINFVNIRAIPPTPDIITVAVKKHVPTALKKRTYTVARLVDTRMEPPPDVYTSEFHGARVDEKGELIAHSILGDEDLALSNWEKEMTIRRHNQKLLAAQLGRSEGELLMCKSDGYVEKAAAITLLDKGLSPKLHPDNCFWTLQASQGTHQILSARWWNPVPLEGLQLFNALELKGNAVFPQKNSFAEEELGKGDKSALQSKEGNPVIARVPCLLPSGTQGGQEEAKTIEDGPALCIGGTILRWTGQHGNIRERKPKSIAKTTIYRDLFTEHKGYQDSNNAVKSYSTCDRSQSLCSCGNDLDCEIENTFQTGKKERYSSRNGRTIFKSLFSKKSEEISCCHSDNVAKEMRIIVQGKVGQVVPINAVLENVGTTAIKFHWLLPSVILPRDKLYVPMIFRSQHPGIFTETWSLKTSPELEGGADIRFIFKGLARLEEDFTHDVASFEFYYHAMSVSGLQLLYSMIAVETGVASGEVTSVNQGEATQYDNVVSVAELRQMLLSLPDSDESNFQASSTTTTPTLDEEEKVDGDRKEGLLRQLYIDLQCLSFQPLLNVESVDQRKYQYGLLQAGVDQTVDSSHYLSLFYDLLPKEQPNNKEEEEEDDKIKIQKGAKAKPKAEKQSKVIKSAKGASPVEKNAPIASPGIPPEEEDILVFSPVSKYRNLTKEKKDEQVLAMYDEKMYLEVYQMLGTTVEAMCDLLAAFQ